MSRLYQTCPHCGAHLDHGERCDCPGALGRGARETARIVPPERAYIPPRAARPSTHPERA